MSATIQQAIVQEALDLSHQFRENAALRNGIPTRPTRNVVAAEPPVRPLVKLMRKPREPSTSGATQAAAPAVVAPAATAITSSLPAWAKGALVAGTLGLGGIGGALITSMERGSPPPADIPSTNRGTPAARGPAASGDLLRWLSGEGYDRPPRPQSTGDPAP